MKTGFFVFLLPFAFLAAEAKGLIDASVRDLYSSDFKVRSRAARILSAAESPEEISKIIEAFESELLCTKRQPRPKMCHDPRFIYNAILVAGNLSARSHLTPWDFLVRLWKGNSLPSSQEGTFFSRSADGGHRENVFAPYRSDLKPTGTELEAFLLETIKKADIWASCKWPLSKLAKLSKKKTVSGYQTYSYDRNYSPELQPQYEIRNVMTWIYQGERRITCNTASDIFVDARTNAPFGFSIKNTSGESLELAISLYRLPDAKALCSYTIRHDGADPLNAADLSADRLFQTFFDYDPEKCRPKQMPGYEFAKIP